MALGLDPDRCTFWVQSDLPEVCELTWVLSTLTPMGLLERCHSFKDKTSKGIAASHGLFSYPVLMAADILLFQSEIVPVGKDQKQHLEVARDIAIKFNNTFGETFVVPEPAINESTAIVPGLDGQKMSKSYGNTIPIFIDDKPLRKIVMSIKTDATPVEEPKNPDTCNLYTMLKLFMAPERLADALADKTVSHLRVFIKLSQWLQVATFKTFLFFHIKKGFLIRLLAALVAVRFLLRC